MSEYRVIARTRRLERKIRAKCRAQGWDIEPPLNYRLFIATHPKGGMTRFARRALHSA